MNGIEKVGEVAGQVVAVRRVDPAQEILRGVDPSQRIQQEILVESRELTNLLMTLAGTGVIRGERSVDGRHYLHVIRHNEPLDRALVELIDTLVEIRYRHPTFVQLRLEESRDPAPSTVH